MRAIERCRPLQRHHNNEHDAAPDKHNDNPDKLYHDNASSVHDSFAACRLRAARKGLRRHDGTFQDHH
jgi:hypothetical protein